MVALGAKGCYGCAFMEVRIYRIMDEENLLKSRHVTTWSCWILLGDHGDHHCFRFPPPTYLHIFSPQPFLAISTGKGFPPHKSNPWVVTSDQEADLGLLRCTKPNVNNGKKSYQPQQVRRISEASTSTNRKFGDWNNFNFSRHMLHLQDFPLKKTEISTFASGKTQSPKTTMPFWFIHTQPAPLIWKEWMGFTTFILHLSLHLPTRWGVFFPANSLKTKILSQQIEIC